jgi:hypothetical protein
MDQGMRETSMKRCKRIALTLLLISTCALGATVTSAQDHGASTLLHQALESQGGEQKLRAIQRVQWSASGYRNELEQSERPEGPYITEFLAIREIDDYAGDRLLYSVDATVYPVYKSSSTTVVEDGVAMQSGGGPFTPGTSQTVLLAKERMALNPERLLLTALDKGDAQREADVKLQGVPQNVIRFTLDGAPVRVFLNAYTHLPTAMDYSGPLAHTGYYAFLGDVTLRTYYSLWWLAKGGIHLPMERTIECNGLPDQMFVVSKLELDFPLNSTELTIPTDIKSKFLPHAKPWDLADLPLGDPSQPAHELASGIVFIPGSWNTTIVRQNDGIVILEAPISSGYSSQAIAEAQKRFPNMPIKAVITTSDSWPHIAGIREFVARGIPIYALDLNQPILERLIGASRTSKPDLLARSPRKPDFHLISQRTTLGRGSNRLEIIPIRGETSERQMMVYIPEHHLLYGSDPFQKLPNGSYFYPQTVTELTAAVAREHLQPERFFMMHVGPTPWDELQEAIVAAGMRNTPDGILQ